MGSRRAKAPLSAHDGHDHGPDPDPHHGHGHGHGHGHHHHHHGPADPGDWRYGLGLAVNLGFVAVEFTFGVISGSAALMADAGHNLSDALGLALAGGAAWLSRLAPRGRRTYGYGKATVLAALANAVLLVFACGAIAFEAARRLMQPVEVASTTVMVVAAIGFVINLGTAALFFSSRGHDLNARGAFLHMAADAAVSLGVVVAGGLIWITGWSVIDPLVGLAIVAVILAGTWGLLRDSLDMALDAAPPGTDPEAIAAWLAALPGVGGVHHLHVWPLSTTRTALTAHLVRSGPGEDADLIAQARQGLKARFGIDHATLQLETAGTDCAGCQPGHG